MKSGVLWLLAVAGLMAVVITLGLWLRADDRADNRVAMPDAADQAEVLSPMLATTQAPVLPPSGVVDPLALARGDTALLPLPEQQADAVASMSEARLKGDPLAPPVSRSPQGEAPTAAEMADPQAYQRYEARQNKRVYQAYIKAAAVEIPRLQEDISRARREGIPEAEIRQGEEKLRRIQAMRDQLQADHPDAAGSAAAE